MNEFFAEKRKEIFACTILGRPQQRGSKVAMRTNKIDRRGRRRIILRDSNKLSTDWMKYAAEMARHAWGDRELISEPVMLSAQFYFNRPMSHFGTGRNAAKLKPSAPRVHGQSPDLAKLLRCLEDALTGVVYVDDRLLCAYAEPTGRFWTLSDERVDFQLFVKDRETNRR